MSSLEQEKGGKSTAKYTALKQELSTLGQAISKADREIDTLSKDIADNQVKIKTYETSIKKTSESLQELELELKNLQNTDITPKGLEELRKELAKITDKKIENIPTDLKELQQVINSLTDDELKAISKSILEIKQSADILPDSARKGAEGIQDLVESAKGSAQAADEINHLKSQILQFFSITNAIQLFKRSIQSAFDTVKELDAVMTETAVVTEFSIGDMWERLPEYSAEATKLGASIRDLYAATTLYYQQGLQTEAAMGVGIETMKMARIANMEAADATQAMTAALRGFNMEVNEINATKVNDVYSELAAITAADTEQIATAMSKTASIAASANMEFETTSALLAQIIETTQEAPETAGTAMKTIIARFTEVKKLFDEGMLSGEDSEGEEININKIDEALKTVGISLKDFLNGTKGIDDIFLELASKWSGLDLATQRYIATMAAGSRQQSRFIAMMSNYGRTMELVDAANNSAGASQRQFDKTLESMEAKLQKLKNAWDQFAMGLANNEILKGAVDLLTGTLETINKLTESISGGDGLTKSIISLMMVIGALKGGGALFNKALGGIGQGLGISDKKNRDKSKQKLIKNNSEKENQVQGEKDGKAYVSGWNRAIEQGKQGGISEGIKGFFGETKDVWKEISKDKQNQLTLDEMFEKQAELTPNWDFEQYEEIRITYETEGFEAAREKFVKLGGSAEIAGGKTKQFTLDLNSVGQTSIIVGSALGLLGNYFNSIGNTKAAEAVSTLSTVLIGLGSILSTLTTLSSSLAKVVTFAGGQITIAGLGIQVVWWQVTLVIMALVGVVYLLVKAFKNAQAASPEGQFKAAKEAAEEAAEAANEAAEAYNNLKSSLESLEGKEISLENLTIGTQEWKDAVQELNNQILDLIELYPELAEFISYNDSGILTISEEGKNLVLDKHLQRQRNTQTAKIGANINELRAQQNLDYSELDSNLKIVIEEKIESSNYKNNNTISSEFKKRQQEILDSQTPHYGSESAFLEQNTVKNYDKEETEALARAIASGDWKGREEQIATITGTSDPKEFVNTEEYKELRNFGQALIESDAAIKIFTDSLENAAILNADVSEEYKNSLSGIYDTEAIEKMVAAEEEKIDLSTAESRKEWEREYADAMGYQYEDGKFYSGEGENKKEVTVLDQDIKSQLAAINVQKKMTDNLSKVSNELDNLYNSGIKLGQSFINMASEANGAGLTLADLDSLEGALNEDLIKRDENGKITQWSQELADLYTEVGHLYSSPEEFYRIISEAYSQAQLTREQSEAKMGSMGLTSNAFNQANIDTGTLDNIVNEIYKVFLTSGKQTATELNNTLGAIMTDLEPDQAQIFADALSLIDWSNIDSVEELSKILNELGFDSDAAGVDIEALEKQIIEAAKATKIFNLDKIKEEIGTIEDLVKDLEDREDTERTFTKEERDLMIGVDQSLTGQFVATGIDEFVYVGNSIETLITALDANTAALLSEYGEQVAHNAEMSDKWQNLVDNGSMWTNGQNEYQVLSSIAQSGSLEGYSFEGVINIMEKAGMGVDSGRSLSGYTPAQLAEIIMADYAQYGSNQARQENIAAYNDYNTNLEQIRLSKMSGQDILNDKQGSNTNKEEVLNAKLATEGLTEEYEATTKALKEQNNALASNEKLLKASITDAKNYEDKLTELAKAYDENKDALVDTNKGTREYQKALTNITKAAKEAFGDNITEDFVENNLDLFEDWYKGAKGSADRLRSALVDSLIEASNGTESEVSQIRDIVSRLDGLDFDIYGHADATQLFNELASVMRSAEEAARAMEVLGYSVTWEETGVKRMLILDPESPTGKRMVDVPEYKAVVTDGLGNRAGVNRSSYGGNKSGGGGSKKEKWENPYDEFYNTVEDINEELRTREKLERRYQALLDKTGTKASNLVKNAWDQIKSLEKEKRLREGLLQGRNRQMSDVESKYSDLSKYAWYNEQDGTIEIDWEKIEALDGSTNEKLTSRIEEYIGKLEEQQDLIEQEEDELEAIEETLREIRDQGKDEYFDLEAQIKEALIDSRQQEIDRLSEINDSINDTNSRLIDAMQSSIDKYRQDRENERTEEELSDKQRRLAYLQQDTSGANALDIMQLQEEIDQAQEDYTDTLIDQKISELQQQNDEAAEQREKQIELMQAQLDKWVESGEIWAEVYNLMNTSMDDDGIKAGSELEALLMDAASFEGMSNLEKMKWLEELENNVAMAIQWLMVGNSTKGLLSTGQVKKDQSITFTTKDGKPVTGTVQEDGTVKTSTGEVYKDVYRSYDGKTFYTTEDYIEPAPEETKETEQTTTTDPTEKTIKVGGKINAKGAKIYGWPGGTGQTQYFEDDPIYKVLDIQGQYLKVRWHKRKSGTTGWFKKGDVKAYKQGGLADFTGPAWLDGTKSKPEYILNADQTKAFFELVDVLSGLNGIGQNSQITGDSIYDVDINVESIGSDYDVEQLAQTVKRMINDDARYRNNNAINLSR